jgi:hypothetical protein
MENENFKKLELELQPLVDKLNSHEIYNNINSFSSLKIFMEYHVYASWDSMSLLKGLQNVMYNNRLMWTPTSNIATRYINELMLEEESDMLPNGKSMSHYELYLSAMKEVGCSIEKIQELIRQVNDGERSIRKICKDINLPEFVISFLETTFSIVKSKSKCKLSSSIYFAREGLIPVIFPKILKSIGVNTNNYKDFKFYLERHIFLDKGKGEGSHSDLARQTLIEFCGGDETNWDKAKKSAIDSLNARIILWDGILSIIRLGDGNK